MICDREILLTRNDKQVKIRTKWLLPFSSFIAKYSIVGSTIVTRNGKIAWKHEANGPSFALILRTKIY